MTPAELFRLVDRSALGPSGVTAIDTPVGRLAVGISEGEPFAVSNRCRHLAASLGEVTWPTVVSSARGTARATTYAAAG
jgi:hypothetical protein